MKMTLSRVATLLTAVTATSACGGSTSGPARSHNAPAVQIMTAAVLESALVSPKDLPYGDTRQQAPPYRDPAFCGQTVAMESVAHVGTDIRLLPPPPNLYGVAEQVWGYADQSAAQKKFAELQTVATKCPSAHAARGSLGGSLLADIVIDPSKVPGKHVELQLIVVLRSREIALVALERFDTTTHLGLAAQVDHAAVTRLEQQVATASGTSS